MGNNVGIIVLYRAGTPHPTPGICYLRLQLHGTNSRKSPSAHPDGLLYFHLFRSVGPRGGANLLATRLLRGAGRLRTLPAAGAPRNLSGLADRCAALVPLPFFSASASSPSWRRFRVHASVYTIPRMCDGSVPTSAEANYLSYCLPSTASEVQFCNFAPRLASFSSLVGLRKTSALKSRLGKNRNIAEISQKFAVFASDSSELAKAVQMGGTYPGPDVGNASFKEAFGRHFLDTKRMRGFFSHGRYV